MLPPTSEAVLDNVALYSRFSYFPRINSASRNVVLICIFALRYTTYSGVVINQINKVISPILSGKKRNITYFATSLGDNGKLCI